MVMIKDMAEKGIIITNWVLAVLNAHHSAVVLKRRYSGCKILNAASPMAHFLAPLTQSLISYCPFHSWAPLHLLARSTLLTRALRFAYSRALLRSPSRSRDFGKAQNLILSFRAVLNRGAAKQLVSISKSYNVQSSTEFTESAGAWKSICHDSDETRE